MRKSLNCLESRRQINHGKCTSSIKMGEKKMSNSLPQMVTFTSFSAPWLPWTAGPSSLVSLPNENLLLRLLHATEIEVVILVLESAPRTLLFKAQPTLMPEQPPPPRTHTATAARAQEAMQGGLPYSTKQAPLRVNKPL